MRKDNAPQTHKNGKNQSANLHKSPSPASLNGKPSKYDKVTSVPLKNEQKSLQTPSIDSSSPSIDALLAQAKAIYLQKVNSPLVLLA